MIKDTDNINDLDDVACPICGAIGRFKYHANYKRHLVDISGERIVSITRVRCTSCKHTHALIPKDVIPYKLYSETFAALVVFAFCLSVSKSYILKRYDVSIETLKRYIRCAKRQASLIFACTPSRQNLHHKLKGCCISILSHLSKEILGKKFTENIRLNSLAPT